jgi:hypothetical protein
MPIRHVKRYGVGKGSKTPGLSRICELPFAPIVRSKSGWRCAEQLLGVRTVVHDLRLVDGPQDEGSIVVRLFVVSTRKA